MGETRDLTSVLLSETFLVSSSTMTNILLPQNPALKLYKQHFVTHNQISCIQI